MHVFTYAVCKTLDEIYLFMRSNIGVADVNKFEWTSLSFNKTAPHLLSFPSLFTLRIVNFKITKFNATKHFQVCINKITNYYYYYHYYIYIYIFLV